MENALRHGYAGPSHSPRCVTADTWLNCLTVALVAVVVTCPTSRRQDNTAVCGNLAFVVLRIRHLLPSTSACSFTQSIAPQAWVLGYFVIVFSVLLYSTINWANEHVSPSTNFIYTPFQPAAAALLSALIIESGYNNHHSEAAQLDLPGWNALGVIGIAAGLALVLYDEFGGRPLEKSNRGVDPPPQQPLHPPLGEQRPLLSEYEKSINS